MARLPPPSGSPEWGRKPYTFNPPLVIDKTDPITVKSNLAGYFGFIQTARERTYVPENPYPDGRPTNPIPARRAGNSLHATNVYVTAFQNWISSGKRLFGDFANVMKRRGGI